MNYGFSQETAQSSLYKIDTKFLSKYVNMFNTIKSSMILSPFLIFIFLKNAYTWLYS